MTQPFLQVSSSVRSARWQERSFEPLTALKLRQSHSVSEVVARVLAGRGQTYETAGLFLDPTLKNSLPDPDHLKDMRIGVARVIQALDRGENIAVFGDYDVDGATSSALLYRFFEMIGVPLMVYIPDRVAEGYGPNAAAFSAFKAQGIDLVITVDCGTTAFEPLAHARAIGLDVIVLDHHAAAPKLPEAAAVINPNRLDEDSPLKTLAAVGVSFVFLVGLNRALRASGFYKACSPPDLMSLLDLVALGTVCDVMPLQGLNRAFVKQGLKVMRQRRNPGLKALCDVAQIGEAPAAYHLGFVLGPRINAGGRVGEAGLGSLLLRSGDPQVCQAAAERLHAYNEERKSIESAVLESAMDQAHQQTDRAMIVVGSSDWHPGVIGIVAGRLKEHFHRPACVISFDDQGLGKGSGRSVTGLDLGASIHAAHQLQLILGGGGHAMAAGFSLSQDQLPAFHDFLDQRTAALGLESRPTLLLDGALSLRGATVDLIQDLEQLAPYGVGNPSPKFAFPHVSIARASVVGAQHIKCILRQPDGASLEAIAFRCVDTPLGNLLCHAGGHALHVAGSLSINAWMGEEKPQLVIEDAAPCVS